MHTRVAEDGRISILAPLSRAGDALTLRAELDLVVAVSACSAPTCNNHSFGPIGLEVLAPSGTPGSPGQPGLTRANSG